MILGNNFIVKGLDNRNYSDETKFFFCYAIYSISSSAYLVVRSELPLIQQTKNSRINSKGIEKNTLFGICFNRPRVHKKTS